MAILLMTLLLSWLYPPEITDTHAAKEFAKEKLAELAPIKRSEKILLGVFGWLLLLWAGVPKWVFGRAERRTDLGRCAARKKGA